MSFTHTKMVARTTRYDGHELTGLTQIPRLNVVCVTKEKREQFGERFKSWYVVEEAYIFDLVIWQSPDGTVYEASPNSLPRKIANSLSEYITKSNNS